MTQIPKWPLFASLLLYFFLTAALIVKIPLGASPDEAAHWQYVQHIVETGQLPTFRGAIPPSPGYEFHQPPLYYLLCAPLWKLAGVGAQQYACRAVSLLCGLLTIWAIWGAARLVFPTNRHVAALAAAFSALWPLHQGVGAGSNNDALAGLLGALLFYGMARTIIEGASWRAAWQLGIVAGLSILTKNTLLTVVLVAFVALIWRCGANSKIRFLPALGVSFGLTLLLSGAYLLRNQRLYGDPFALSVFSGAASAGTPGFPQFSGVGMSFLTYARGMAWMIFLTAWGFFGGPNAAVAATGPLSAAGPRVPQLWMAPLMLLFLLAPLGAILGWRRLEPEESSQRRTTVAAWLSGVVLVVLAWAQFAFAHFSGGQARYLHPVLLPVCILAAAGWCAFWGEERALKIASGVVGASLVFLTLLNVLVWKTLV